MRHAYTHTFDSLLKFSARCVECLVIQDRHPPLQLLGLSCLFGSAAHEFQSVSVLASGERREGVPQPDINECRYTHTNGVRELLVGLAELIHVTLLEMTLPVREPRCHRLRHLRPLTHFVEQMFEQNSELGEGEGVLLIKHVAGGYQYRHSTWVLLMFLLAECEIVARILV